MLEDHQLYIKLATLVPDGVKKGLNVYFKSVAAEQKKKREANEARDQKKQAEAQRLEAKREAAERKRRAEVQTPPTSAPPTAGSARSIRSGLGLLGSAARMITGYVRRAKKRREWDDEGEDSPTPPPTLDEVRADLKEKEAATKALLVDNVGLIRKIWGQLDMIEQHDEAGIENLPPSFFVHPDIIVRLQGRRL